MPGSAEFAEAARRAVRVLVVYQHPLFRDIVVRLLTGLGIEVVGAVPATELESSRLQPLNPNVILLDREAKRSLDGHEVLTILDPGRTSISKVVIAGLSDTVMVVWSRYLVPDITAERLVETVLDGPRADLLP
jgi:CheY-like chemotaxis protein